MFVFFLSFVTYLLLSWSGSWSIQEMALAFFVATVVSYAAPNFSRSNFWSLRGLNPRRWLNFFYFVFGPYAVALWDANWDVAKRAITGEINPGIAKFDPRMKTDLGRMLLALFIVLTPGTYPVDVDEDGVYYIHCLSLTSAAPPESELGGSFAPWVRRIVE